MIKAWSWSRYADYQQCPRKAKYKHVDRMKEPGSKAMERGIMIHDLADSYIKGDIKHLPDELKNFKKEFGLLQRQYKKNKGDGMVIAQSWGFTKDWEACRWDDWDRAWVRIKLDLAHPVKEGLVITDWKTGKARDEEIVNYTQQLELYALATMLMQPKVKVAYPRLVFLDAERVFPAARDDLRFEQGQVEELKMLWEKRTHAMLHDKIFAAKPNNKCRWCHFRKDNDGPCEF